MNMADAVMAICEGRIQWIERVREAYCAARNVDVGDEVTIPAADWKRIADAIKAPVRPAPTD